jgi:hypothetical protein
VADDIVERLRVMYVCDDHTYAELEEFALRNDAADIIERLQAERKAIDALHQPDAAPEHDPQCIACHRFWPCPTHLTLHPEEARRER